MEVDIIELDGKEYIEIDKIKGYKYTYVFLSNINDDDDFFVRRLVLEDGEYYYDSLEDKFEFEHAMKLFYDKHGSLEKYLKED